MGYMHGRDRDPVSFLRCVSARVLCCNHTGPLQILVVILQPRLIGILQLQM